MKSLLRTALAILAMFVNQDFLIKVDKTIRLKVSVHPQNLRWWEARAPFWVHFIMFLQKFPPKPRMRRSSGSVLGSFHHVFAKVSVPPNLRWGEAGARFWVHFIMFLQKFPPKSRMRRSVLGSFHHVFAITGRARWTQIESSHQNGLFPPRLFNKGAFQKLKKEKFASTFASPDLQIVDIINQIKVGRSTNKTIHKLCTW